MSTVVDRNKTTFKNIAINKEFNHFSMDSGFEIITCKPYRSKTKGKVESLAKLVDRLNAYNKELNIFENKKYNSSTIGINCWIASSFNKKI